MRRRNLAALILSLVLSLSGCGRGKPEAGMESWSLYFPVRSFADAAGGGAMEPETVYLPAGADVSGTARPLLEKLLNGPSDERLQSPFPAGTRLLSLKLDGSRAVADLSAEYGTLSGVALTLADCAITLTLTQLPEISVVQVTVRGQELAYRDRQFLTAREVLLEPEGDVVGTVDALLYFPNAAGELTGEARTLPLYEGDTQVEAVLSALEGGPENRELFPAFPEGFRVRSVWQEEELCYVNLSAALLDTLTDSGRLFTALYALDRSLCSLETVRAVLFLADGEFVREYGGASLAEIYQKAEAAS